MQRSVLHRLLLRLVVLAVPAVLLLGTAGPAVAGTICVKSDGTYVICV